MKKRRTRQHVIEDLGLNHIEKHILLSGNVLRRFGEYDYGYDGMIDTFNEQGEAENLSFKIQLKSTDGIQLSPQKAGFIIDLSKRDLELWLKNQNPVLLILYDAKEDKAYFADLQTYFNENRLLLADVRKFVRVFLSPQSIFDKIAIQELQQKYNY
jgi:Domain of unknown function (DUF4365)